MATTFAINGGRPSLKQLSPVSLKPGNPYLSPSDIHVLVVDDERMSRTVVASLLRKFSYKVTVVDSGVEALETLKRAEPGTFHLVLTDLVMPEVDGLDLLRFVREDETLRSVPVVMMSASEQTETVFQCIRDGAEDYLLKPLRRVEAQYIWQHVYRRQHQFSRVPRLGEDEDEFDEAHAKFCSDNVATTLAHLAEAAVTRSFVECARCDRAGEVSTSQPAVLHTHAVARVEPGSKQYRGSYTLSQWLSRRTTLKVEEAFDIFCRTISLLKVFHLQGKSFGRLRPSQLLLTPSGSVEASPATIPVPQHEVLWYASPEEHSGAASPQSDVYSLGVLFLELFFTAGMDMEAKGQLVASLRERTLPDVVLEKPEMADFLLSVIQPDPLERPMLVDIIYSGTLPKLLSSLSAITPAVHVECQRTSNRTPDTLQDKETLLDFLNLLHGNVVEESHHLRHDITILDADIHRVQQLLAHRTSSKAELCEPAGVKRSRASFEMESPVKSQRSVRQLSSVVESTTSEGPSSSEPAACKFGRIAPVVGQLESVYFNRRGQLHDPSSYGRCLSQFCKDLNKYARYSKLIDRATVKHGDMPNLNDMVCSIAFDRDDEYFATAGVSRRLKVFDFNSVLDLDSHIHYPVLEINARSKLSCVSWNPYVKSNFICSDYDGTVQLWDASTKTEQMQFEEHARRVWSIDFSPTDPTRFISGSDDHTVKLWCLNSERSATTVDLKANVCSVQFHPTDSNLIACGSANYRVFLYDLRNASAPLAIVGGHSKAVSYVRFLNSSSLVSASTDSQLRLWNLPTVLAAGRTNEPDCIYRGHTNEKNFVGLTVSPDGYIGCGSEDNSVYTYFHALPMPVTKYHFGGDEAYSSRQDSYQHFVSSVCWSRQSRYLTVANSMGFLKVLEFQ